MAKNSILVLLLALLPASQAGPIAFEVASIKPAELPAQNAIATGKWHSGITVEGSRVNIGLLSLGTLIQIAFKVRPYQVYGPGWIESQRFDIRAKMPEGAIRDDVPQMLQAMLSQRFGLRVHREQRQLNSYVLVAGKNLSKLKPSVPSPELPAGPEEDSLRISVAAGGNVLLQIRNVSMEQFAEMLTRLQDRPVFDKTGLKANYDIALELPKENLIDVTRAAGGGLLSAGSGAAPVQASEPSANSIVRSVQQLGLRLESRKETMEVIVIDHIEKMPTEN